MKKILLSLFVVLSFALYALGGRFKSNTGDEAAQTNPPIQHADNTLPTSIPVEAVGYKDGSYTGAVADAYYGPFQVKAIISGGKITDVQFLQYPNDRGNSIAINREAMPYLRQEAISAQSAQVDIITGATQSSGAFRVSLKSALDQARI